MFELELTKHIASLSKLSFTEDELAKMTKEMTDIIKMVDNVKMFDKTNDEFRLCAKEYESLREDEIKKSVETGKILANASRTKDNSFVVPKVV